MRCWSFAICLGLELVLVSACNVFDHELPVPGGPVDALAAADADAAPDAATDAGIGASLGCDLTKPFGSAVLVQGVASSTPSALDASLRLSPDEKTAYFFSSRTGNQLLYTAIRASVADPFENVAALANVNTSNQYNPTITADGQTLYFASFRPGGTGNNDIYQAARNPTTADFGTPRLAPNVNTAGSEVQPYVTHDGTTMYFVRTLASGQTAIFRATGSVAGGFINAAGVPELAFAANESDPVQSADGLTLFWSSDRSGNADVWQAQRSSTSAPFGNVMPVVSVNTSGPDAPSDVSEDGCRLYITSTRSGRTGIYVATRPL
jgi:Tol biopolymer transport system component